MIRNLNDIQIPKHVRAALRPDSERFHELRPYGNLSKLRHALAVRPDGPYERAAHLCGV